MQSLPDIALNKLAALRLAAGDAKALIESGRKSLSSLREREAHLRMNLGRMDGAQAALDAVTAEIARTEALLNGRNARVTATNDLVRSLERWLDRHDRAVFRAAVVEAAPKEGETLEAAIARVREEIDGLHGELRRIRRAPRPAAEVKAAINARIDAMAEKGRPRIYGLDTAEPRLDLLPSTLRGDTLGQTFNREVVENMLAWLHRDALKAAIAEQIGTIKGGISAKDKEKAERDIPARILELERQEESLIEQAMAAGFDVLRRPQASPLAVLGIEFADEAEMAEAA